MSFERENTCCSYSKVYKITNRNITSPFKGAPGAVDGERVNGINQLDTNVRSQTIPVMSLLKAGGVNLAPKEKCINCANHREESIPNLSEDSVAVETQEIVETVACTESKLGSNPSQSNSGLNPAAQPFNLAVEQLDLSSNVSFVDGNVSLLDDIEDPIIALKCLKEKNFEQPVIAHLNINSLSSKFEPLTEMIKDSLDFLLVTESKLDDTFPMGQFQIEGFSRPIRLDRTRNGGGMIIFVRGDLTCYELKPRVLYPELECTFLEMRIRQSKWLVVVGYNPQKENISNFLGKVSFELDKVLPKYDNLLMLGDWNSTVKEEDMENFCDIHDLENLIKEPTCFKSTENPSSIDIILTNRKHNFQHTRTVETGLSDFHKMTVTVMKNHSKKKDFSLYTMTNQSLMQLSLEIKLDIKLKAREG